MEKTKKITKQVKEQPMFTAWQKRELGNAVEHLGRALSSPFNDEVLREASWAINSIQKFQGEIKPTPKLTKEEANWSASIHTYFRKYMDSPNSCILYRMVAEDRANNTWYNFIKELIKTIDSCKNVQPKNRNKLIGLNNIINKVNDLTSPSTTDDMILRCALREIGQEDFVIMINNISK